MTERVELKPCPFCGGNDIGVIDSPNTADDWVASFCRDCFAQGPHNYSEPHANKAWNGRAEG